VKAAYLLDQTFNPKAAASTVEATEVYRAEGKAVISDDGKTTEWVIPKGTVVEGEEALLRVSTGQAEPVDEECSKACGMTPAQLVVAQRNYMSAMAGIRGKKDHELFMAGVIDGYEPGSTDDKPIYKPGKLWDKYQAALKAKTEDE
jgi:hypothetical protein